MSNEQITDERHVSIATEIIGQLGGAEHLKKSLGLIRCWVMEHGVGMILEASKEVKNTFEDFIPAPPFGYRIEIVLDIATDIYDLKYQKVWFMKDNPEGKQFIHENKQHTMPSVYNDMLYPIVCGKLGYKINSKVCDEIWELIQPKITKLD